jgi:hypothetical protein
VVQHRAGPPRGDRRDLPLTNLPLTHLPLTHLPLTDLPLTDLPLTAPLAAPLADLPLATAQPCAEGPPRVRTSPADAAGLWIV